MNRLKYLSLASVAAICFMVAVPNMRLGSALTSESPLNVLTGTMMRLRMAALPPVTTVRNGLPVVSSSVPVHGFMAAITSVAT